MDVWKERGVFPPDFLHRVQREIGKRLSRGPRFLPGAHHGRVIVTVNTRIYCSLVPVVVLSQPSVAQDKASR